MQITRTAIEALALTIKEKNAEMKAEQLLIDLGNSCVLAKMVNLPITEGRCLFINDYPVGRLASSIPFVNTDALADEIQEKITTIIEEPVSEYARKILGELNMGDGNGFQYGFETKLLISELGINICEFYYKDELFARLPYTSKTLAYRHEIIFRHIKDIVKQGCLTGEFICTFDIDDINIVPAS